MPMLIKGPSRVFRVCIWVSPMMLRCWPRCWRVYHEVKVLTLMLRYHRWCYHVDVDVEVLTLMLRCWPRCWGVDLEVKVLTLMLRYHRWCYHVEVDVDVEVSSLMLSCRCWSKVLRGYVGVCIVMYMSHMQCRGFRKVPRGIKIISTR